MTSINNIFFVNADKELEINKIEAFRIDSFAKLIKRDTGSKGDVSGKRLYIATGELYYIYLQYDIRSIYYNLSDEDKEIKARKDSKLPDNWKTDKVFEQAIKDYKDCFKLTAAGNAYIVAEKSYFSITEDTREMQEEVIELKATLKKTQAQLKVSKNDPLQITSLTADITAILTKLTIVQKNIMANVKLFKELGDTVKILATKFIEEGGNLKSIVGDGELGRREA